MNPAKIVNFDSFRAYRWLVTIAEPDAKLYEYLRTHRVDLKHTTPVDVVVFSMRDPSRFGTMLGLGAVLGAGELMNPATYGGGEPCRLLRTPLAWLREGIERCAVVLDPLSAKPILDWAPGNLAAMDDRHANELIGMGVDPKRLVVPVQRVAA